MLEISFIVPVYNVEKYLRRCIESILQQNLEADQFEIIIIDDGSTDASGNICDEYAHEHANIHVIHQENMGLSAARNRGIEAVAGKYIQFIDSDDYLEPAIVNHLILKMDSCSLDVLRFSYQNVNDNYEIIDLYTAPKAFVDYSEDICDGQTFLTERLGFGCYAWQFILRRELLENCYFKEGIYFEDTEWTPRMLMKATRVASTPIIAYNYLIRRGSITQSTDKIKKLKIMEDRMNLIDALSIQKQGVGDRRWFNGMISHITITIISDISLNYFYERRYYIRELKKKRVFPLSEYHAAPTAVRKIRMANQSPMVLCLMLHLMNK